MNMFAKWVRFKADQQMLWTKVWLLNYIQTFFLHLKHLFSYFAGGYVQRRDDVVRALPAFQQQHGESHEFQKHQKPTATRSIHNTLARPGTCIVVVFCCSDYRMCLLYYFVLATYVFLYFCYVIILKRITFECDNLSTNLCS